MKSKIQVAEAKTSNNDTVKKGQVKMSSMVIKTAKSVNDANVNAIEIDKVMLPVDYDIELSKQMSKLFELPDARSAEEVQGYINNLPDLSCPLIRGCGEALWYLPEDTGRKIVYAVLQKRAGNWIPYLNESEDPMVAKILTVLEKLESVSETMADLNESCKSVVMKLARDYFGHPENYSPAPVNDAVRSLLFRNLPAASCLPEVLRGRVVGKTFDRTVDNLREDELQLAKMLKDAVTMDYWYAGIYCVELYDAVDRYIEGLSDESED